MLKEFKQKALQEIKQAKNIKALEEIYRQYLGRKGELTAILRSLKDLTGEEKKEKGKLANQVKKEIEQAIKEKNKMFYVPSSMSQDKWIDITAPGVKVPEGHLHPITLVQRQIEEIFQSMGFTVADGPEVENEHYNFDALNIPENHPARDIWDTFWLKDMELLLRTHTSPAQTRYMEKNNPPLRVIAPGRCFRHEATDASHDIQFNQVEGLMIGDNVSVADFKGIMGEFLKRFFDQDIEMRLRPGYFPFVEPGFEIDARRKGQKWLELMGAGMVHPNVFKAVGYIPNKWQGFAFGMCPDRLAMLKYKINDIRLFYASDLRFLKQF